MTDAVVPAEPQPNRFWPGPWPGLLLTAAIAAAAFGLRAIPGTSTNGQDVIVYAMTH